jgi:hypothetical protein
MGKRQDLNIVLILNQRDLTSIKALHGSIDRLFHIRGVHKLKKHIRYSSTEYLTTEDDWENITIKSEFNLSDYALELNQDNVYKAKLFFEIGMEQGKLILTELNKIRTLFKTKGYPIQRADGYGHAFEVFAISVLHNLDYNECIDHHIVIGSKDGKTDAVYWTSNEIFLYQIKLNYLPEIDLSIMKSNYDHFNSSRSIPGDNVADLKTFYEKNITHVVGVKRIRTSSVSYNRSGPNNKTPLDIYKKYFEFLIFPQEYNSINLTLNIPWRPDNNNPTIRHNNMAFIDTIEYFFFMKADELMDCILRTPGLEGGEKLHKLFYDNVRGKLPYKKTMENTIKLEPSSFSLFNNGVSLTGEVTYEDGSVISIKDPIIVNGQQTVTNLIRTSENLDKIYVPIFVKNTSDSSQKRSIALYNNTQSPIKPLDLLSINGGVREIQKLLIGNSIVKSELTFDSYYLNIYSTGVTSYINTATRIFSKERVIKLGDFVKVYFSYRQPQKLGEWKNALSKQINTIIEEEQSQLRFDYNDSVKVCHAIRLYKSLLDSAIGKTAKSNLQVADLAIQYLLIITDFDIDKTMRIKASIDQEFLTENEGNKKVSLADLYRSNSIIEKINSHLN